ncbi:MAG TPA: helix-turn-helix domain-containing GNAT family N-acetyltransferase [Kofleriaceae bacterium]|nr:helix-turn-helix domain-containing GNAT family N-acetyltransferase [Kofleriaceae bacterium]
MRDEVAAVRRFNRMWTRRIGVLHEGLLGSAYSLAEVRVLYELAHATPASAGSIAETLGLDRGYLSRILARFANDKLITRARAASDARVTILALTARGRSVFAKLDAAQDADVATMLKALPAPARARAIEGMRSIEAALSPAPAGTIVLRDPRPGDLGWIVHRHGVLYAEEYGWDARFEGLVAAVVGEYVGSRDPARDRAWIADRDGEIVGSIFLVAKTKTIAKLRLLYVEPSARGTGLGSRLVDECIAFARRAGYRTITLWTNSVLHAARRIYQRAGFRLVDEAPHAMFGEKLVGQTWELAL